MPIVMSASNAGDLLRTTSKSNIPIIRAIIKDDVSFMSVWSLENRDFQVELEGRREGLPTLTSSAKAEDYIRSMLLRGLVLDERAFAEATDFIPLEYLSGIKPVPYSAWNLC
jgi:hypothetical protein